MILSLHIVGAVLIISYLIIGFFSGSFLGFITSILGGIGAAIIPFAIAKVLENQESILSQLHGIHYKKGNIYAKTECTKCHKEYDENLKSCPYCGNRV